MPSMKMSRTGKWNDFLRLPLTLAAVGDIAGSELRKAGQEYIDMLVQAVESQSEPWRSLSDSWEQYKAANNLDPRIWIATGQFLDALQNATVKRAGKDYLAGLYVDRTHDTPHSGTELAMSQLAIYLEFGSADGSRPPRPLFRPVAYQWEEKFRKNFVVRLWKEVNIKLPW